MLDANIKSITGFILSLCDGNTDKKLRRALDGDAYNPIEEGGAEKFVAERQQETNIQGSKVVVFWFNPPMKKTNSAALMLGFEDDVLVGARADIGMKSGFFSPLEDIKEEFLTDFKDKAEDFDVKKAETDTALVTYLYEKDKAIYRLSLGDGRSSAGYDAGADAYLGIHLTSTSKRTFRIMDD